MSAKTGNGGRPARPRHAQTCGAQTEKTRTIMSTKPTTDPTAILEEIASDPKAPATARVQAAKALVAIRKASEKQKPNTPDDAVTARALRLLKGGRA